MVGTRLVAKFVNFIAHVLYHIQARRTSFDKAFRYAYSTQRNSELRHYISLLYSSSRDAVLHFATLLNLYTYLKYRAIPLLWSKPPEVSYRDLARTWICHRAAVIVHNPQLITIIERYCRDHGLSSTLLSEALDELLSQLDTIERLALRFSFPLWFVKTLYNFFEVEELELILKALNEEQLWLRVNTLVIDYDKALRAVEAEGVVFEIDKDVPFLLRVLETPKPIHELEAFKRGYVVTQDKASVLTVLAMELDPQMRILDACAAPGMKASLIMQLTENKCELFFLDISIQRIKNALPLLKRLGVALDRVHILHSDATSIQIRALDRALVDAPCSDSGAIPRDPAIKMHLLDPKWASSFNELQFRILRSTMNLSPELIVYAVCSLLPWEGEGVTLRVLGSPHYEIHTPSISGDPGYPQYSHAHSVRRLFPHKHRTQGFFIARFRRV